MKERPILFSAPMVRALLEGRKTQTRRVLKPQPVPCLSWSAPPAGTYPSDRGWSRIPAQPGDRLWVREAFYLTDDGEAGCAVHAADEDAVKEHFRSIRETQAKHILSDGWAGPHLRLRSSIHMPRWASRITLIVEAVKIERLQDISEADAIAEGIRRDSSAFMHAGWWVYDGEKLPSGEPANVTTKPIDSFASLWRSINGPDSWDANPWVAAITFRVIAKHTTKGEE